MNNDLISREALKEELAKCGYDIVDFGGLFYIINNAPIVPQTIITEFKGCDNCELERPKGEWVENSFDEHHCNRCGHSALWEEEPDGYYEVQSNFCPNCGADMRGKKNETDN